MKQISSINCGMQGNAAIYHLTNLTEKIMGRPCTFQANILLGKIVGSVQMKGNATGKGKGKRILQVRAKALHPNGR